MEYLHVSSAAELSGSDRRTYRFFEILPGALSWSTLLGVAFLSWQAPVATAVFIILFDLYWLIKTVFLSLHLRANWKRLRGNMAADWTRRLRPLKWEALYQLVILPYYNEGIDVIRGSLDAIFATPWPKERMIIVLAAEERAGEEALAIAENIEREYAEKFGYFLVTLHPKNLPREIPGKGSNIAYAARESVREIIDADAIPYEDVLVSAFDIDTQVYPQYFSCLAHHFLTCEKPYRSSFQPVPLYNNNIWGAPALSRVVATAGTFWQMMQQERPERLTTFSSHSMSLKALAEVGFWQRNIVSEDSRIFWNHFFFYDGDWQVVPISYPVSMDANIGRNFTRTVMQVYRQQRRWTWGVENVPYLLFGFYKTKAIPWRRKFYYIATQLEGFWGLATNPILIFLLGWLPLMVGGDDFNTTLLSYNLPRLTRTLMTLAMLGLIGSAVISTSLLPRPPSPGLGARGRARYYLGWASMALQWLLVPITILFFGALPGLEAQTRLALGGKFRLGFWVTPKVRKAGEAVSGL